MINQENRAPLLICLITCEREGVLKRTFLYQQGRFAKLGKAAASILEALPMLRKLLDETDSVNQLVESCKLYLSSGLFLTELEVLTYFNHHVTFPFLNAIENSSQQELLIMLPKLYKDLCNKDMNTLNNYVVNMHHVTINSLHNVT